MIRRLFLAFALVAGAALGPPAAAQLAPFIPRSTANVAVTGTAQDLTLPTSTSTPEQGLKQIVLTAVGTQTVFFRWDGTTVTVSNGMPVLANSQFVISVPVATTALSVIAAAPGSTAYATLGAGE